MARKSLSGFDAQNQKVTGVGTGTNPTDAVNLAQLQSLLAGLSWHGAVRAASTGNINLASPGAAVDGVNMVAGNRFLAKDQTAAAEKGVYIWNGAAVPATRAVDAVQGTLNAGAAFYVDEGSINADTAWTLATDDPITVGTTALTFNKFGVGVAYTALTGGGLTLDGQNRFAIDTSKVPFKLSTNVGDGSSTSITVTHNLGTLDVLVQLVQVANGETIETDTFRTSANAVQFVFPSAPAAGAYRAIIIG
jgi:hypothetical protein